MSAFALRLFRSTIFLAKVVGAAVALVAVFLLLIVLTGGAGCGLAAWCVTVGTAVAVALRRGRGRTRAARAVLFLPVVLAAALTASVCVPTVPTTRRYLPALPSVEVRHWSLSTGSRVAVYHYPPTGSAPRSAVPLLYLNGGPVRGISLLDHRFLRLLASQGRDVYAYEPAGAGRSELLPMDQYSISRSVRDLGAVLDHLGAAKDQGAAKDRSAAKDRGTATADILGFSSGAVVLTRALATPMVAAHIHRAIIAEPGPMDGPTARLDGQRGRPSARGLAPAPTGPRSTRIPRYAVAFGLMRLGLLAPDTGLIGQAEGDNAFTAADLGSDTASAYCARDAHRIPAEDTARNFSFSPAASLRVQRTVKDSPSLAPRLKRSRVPAMLMIAECSSQVRRWATAVLAADPGIRRTQYLPGVGHHLWNGLDDNNRRAAAVITAFLRNKPAPLPDYPKREDIPAFLRAHK
ncbi:alpha/beta hydrolase [Streptomyces sp. NPDC005435]|uniref:alpha/beta hydrolase n=1 Tax=Streptomyces sp. NPDC005435 TaxID=3154464 RepID=UPI0034531363